MRNVTVLAAVLVFTSTQVAADVAIVESGVKSEITTHTRYDSRCRPNQVVVKILDQPEHGTVTVEAKNIVVPAQSDRGIPQQSHCIGKMVDGVAIYYQSNPGFVGRDGFRYQRLNPRDGGDPFNAEISYTITVK